MKWAPNPFALAERILDKPLSSTDWGTASAYLGEAFNVDARQLLDEIGDQLPLLYALEDIADVVTSPGKLDELLPLPVVKRAQELFKLSDDALRRLLPYLVPVADAEFGPPGAGVGAGHPHASGATFHAAGPIITGDVSYLDPKQGSIADCYLVASMISLAWAAQNKWTDRIHGAWHEAPNRGMKIAFCKTKTTSFPAVSVTAFLPDDANGKTYTIGRDGTEAWPGMIEKSFVVQQSPRPQEPTPADYQFIAANALDPHDACAMLVAGAKHVRGVASADPPKRSSTVRDRCDAHGVTTVPTMAWTFPRKAQTGGVDLAPHLKLATTGLQRNHAYAVLGTLQGMSVAGVEGSFVVLRNPWGTAPLPAVYATGTWSKGENGREDVVLNSSGVFAIEQSVFDDCFSNVGWVEPE